MYIDWLILLLGMPGYVTKVHYFAWMCSSININSLLLHKVFQQMHLLNHPGSEFVWRYLVIRYFYLRQGIHCLEKDDALCSWDSDPLGWVVSLRWRSWRLGDKHIWSNCQQVRYLRTVFFFRKINSCNGGVMNVYSPVLPMRIGRWLTVGGGREEMQIKEREKKT